MTKDADVVPKCNSVHDDGLYAAERKTGMTRYHLVRCELLVGYAWIEARLIMVGMPSLDDASPVGKQPSYVRLYQTGELKRRASVLLERLARCDVCPRNCGVDRTKDELGFCRSPRRPLIASACAHRGEEPPISGRRGSGTIFFANCNLRCIFCQNHEISQCPELFARQAGGPEQLAEVMLRLQDDLRCHNINFVSPSHFAPQVLEALCLAIPGGLRLPLVYNTNSYDSVATLKLLDGVIDVYLPDIKYCSDRAALQLSGAGDYVRASREAIAEMYRQVGAELVLDEEGSVRRGLILRHLVLPGGLAGSEDSLRWLATEVSNQLTLSIMSQYYPSHRASEVPLLSRRVTWQEYGNVVRTAHELGFEHLWAQESGAPAHYRPDFSRDSHPFERQDN